MKKTITDEVVSNITDKIKQEAANNPNFDIKGSIDRESVENLIYPIVEEGFLPILDEIDRLNSAVEKINSAISPSFTAVGVGTAAAGPAGASTYSSTQSQVTQSTTQVKNNVKELKSN